MTSGAARPAGALLTRCAVVALAVSVLSLAVRLSVRDGVPGLAAVYYATPLVLDAAASFFATVVCWRLRRPRLTSLALVATVASGGLYVATSFRWNEPRPPGALRGVFWNVAHGRHGWSGVAQTLQRLDPDVAWLAELSDDDPAADDAIRTGFPQRSFVRAAGGIAVVVRGESTLVERSSLLHASRMALFHVVVDGRAFDALQVDVASNPLVARRPTFDRVLRYVEPRSSSPILVLGDFNTPRDSCAFDLWRGRLAHAFETAGRGLDATWPVPLPVLSLDHVWAGGGLTVRTCETPWTWRSDHLPVVFTFDLP